MEKLIALKSDLAYIKSLFFNTHTCSCGNTIFDSSTGCLDSSLVYYFLVLLLHQDCALR